MENGNKGVNVSGNYLHGYRRQSYRVILALFFTLSAGLMAGTAVAGDINLVLNGKAVHINPPATAHLNEKNWGLGVQYDWDIVNKRWVPFAMASGFSDSNKNASYYAGGGVLRRFQFDGVHADIGAIGFVMTRKDFRNDRPFPGILPAFSMGTDRISVNMTYIPKVHPKAVALWFFQLKIKLSNF